MTKMNASAKAFEVDGFFMMDLIDTFRGSGHCEREWVKYQLLTKKPDVVHEQLKQKKFWR